MVKKSEKMTKEKCYSCGREEEIEHLGRSICKKCFLENMEKRVKRHLGRNLFKKGERVLVVGELEKYLLKKAIKELPLQIFFRKRMPKETKQFDKVVFGKTMDEIDEEFLEGLFEGKLVLNKKKKKFFNILEVLTNEEAEQYAKLRGIKFKIKKRERLLDRWKDFKEIKYNLYKNIKELRKLNF